MEEHRSRLARQASIGRDSGMRLRMTWEDGLSVTVHSWDAVSAITNLRVNTLRIYWAQGKLNDDFVCMNPLSGVVEKCNFHEIQKARRGPAPNPERIRRNTRDVSQLHARLQQQQARLTEAEAHVQRIKVEIANLSQRIEQWNS